MYLFANSSDDEKIVQVAQLLVDKGIDVNLKDENGINAMMRRLRRSSDSGTIVGLVQLFIENGYDLKQTDKYGNNALNLFIWH